MAIKKLKTGLLGGQAEGEYWKIIQVIINSEGAGPYAATTLLGLYKDKRASDAKAPPLDKKTIVLPVTKENLRAGNLIAVAYDGIKAYAARETIIGTDDLGSPVTGPTDADLVDGEDA